jgi:ZIP family zinc transporter
MEPGEDLILLQQKSRERSMQQLLVIIVYTSLAGLALPVGGALASIEPLRPRWLDQELRHGVLAFGGGILLAAVALVLVPHGMRELTVFAAAASVIGGGLLFFAIDKSLTLAGRPASNLIAALLDFIPEAIALGALISTQASLGMLLAVFIGLQNLPEGFNAYRELVSRAHTTGKGAMMLLTGGALLGPIFGVLGYWVLSDAPVATSVTMLFAAGGILYLVFQEIAPQARLANHWGPPLGAVFGFALGLIGTMLVQG